MATYYVSSGLGLDSNSGISVSSPFATIQQAADHTQPGDKVEVMAGTYSADAATGYVLATGHSGAAGAPIVYEGYNGARPVISMPNGGVAAVQFNASYVTFQGFELVGNARNVNLAQAQSLAAQPGSGSNRTINGNGIVVSWNGNPTIDNHVSILNNVVHDFSGNGISAEKSDYITIQGNTVYDNGKYGPYGTSGISIFGSHDSDSTTGYKSFVVGNTIYNNQQLVGSYAIGTSAITDGEGVLIDSNSNFQTDGYQYKGSTLVANNIVYGNSAVGLGAYASSNVDFIGNTAYNNDPTGTRGGQLGSSKLKGGVFENNIAYAGPGGTAFGIDGSNSGVTEDYNVVYGGNASGNGAHDIHADPKFTDQNAANFQLQAGSAAIGSANPAYVRPTDQQGTASYDIGALQRPLTSGPPATPAVTPLTNTVAAAPTLGSDSSGIAAGGTQVGGTQTATASGQSQAVDGNVAAGAQTIPATMVHDAIGGTAISDHSVNIDSAAASVTTTATKAAPLTTGSQNLAATVPVLPPPVTPGSVPGSMVGTVPEDAGPSDAPPAVSVGGTQGTGTQTATAAHPAGRSPAFTLKGNRAAGAHTVAVNFLNDAHGGRPSFQATLKSSVTTIGSGAGGIAVGISEDAYQGDAQFTVSVDGTQIGGTQTATASHAAGKSQVFNVLGAFGAGPHKVSVNFLNDAWGGTAATDRNLYVDGFTAGGVTKSVGLALMAPGSQSFTTPSVIGPATLASNPTLAFVMAAQATTIDGGTAAGKTLTGGGARDLFVLHAGASNGDTITNFKPSLTAGDFLELKGYGTGATLTQVDTTTWTANSASGAIHDIIKLTNAAALVPANVLFA